MNNRTFIFIFFSIICILGVGYSLYLYKYTTEQGMAPVTTATVRDNTDSERSHEIPVSTESPVTLTPRDTAGDAEYYSRTQSLYATNFENTDYRSIGLWTEFEKKILPIYRYNSSTKIYEPFISDLTKIPGFWRAYGKDQLSLMFFVIIGWSDDARYIVFMNVPYEGSISSPLFYLDTQNLEEGIVTVPDFLIGFHDLRINHTKFLGYSKESSGNSSGLFQNTIEKALLFDVNTLQTKELYKNSDQRSTIFKPDFYGEGDGFTGSWKDKSTITLKLADRALAEAYARTLDVEAEEAFFKSQKIITISP